MSPFQPAGARARWRILYDLLRVRQVGDLVDYPTMAEALELDPVKDRTAIQLAMRRAAQELETEDKHAVDAVSGVGYRIVEPTAHLDLARRHQRKAGRSLARGHSKAVNVDFNAVDPETRRAFEVVASAFAAQMDFNRRMDVRQRNLERAVEAVTQRSERTNEELATLRARLARLENETSESA